MTFLWISIKRLKQHELHRTIRILNSGTNNWVEIYTELSKIQKDSIHQLSKLAASLFGGYLLISTLSDGELASFSIGEITASVPLTLALALLSFNFLFCCLHLGSAFAIMEYRVQFGLRIRIPGFSANAYDLYSGSVENQVLLPILSPSYFQELLPISRLIAWLLLLALIAMLLPFAAVLSYLITEQLSLLSKPNTSMLNLASATIGLFFSILGAVCFFIFFLPLPFKKDLNNIRWGFLARVSKSFPHPQASKWLDPD